MLLNSSSNQDLLNNHAFIHDCDGVKFVFPDALSVKDKITYPLP